MSNNGGNRDKSVRVKTARGRKASSTRWLQRQLNDPYVQQAKRDGYRSRAAYKIIELHEKFDIFKPGQRILDLGAAPGGWTQVAQKIIGDKGSILGVDLLPIDPITGVTFMEKDFNDDDAPALIEEALGGNADVVMSDMAANTTGHPPTDHIRIISLCEMAYDFATQILNPGGVFLCKVLRGGTENDLLKLMKQEFTTVKHAKPKSSRSDSAESYVVAMGFRGRKN
ncbi:MAG: RlmE family RNA methyltransferase [Rickettsiales bacterium]|nr:RlmE family RNA methyltransferase [Rickettsiales bacterium]